MILELHKSCDEYDSYRAARVKSLFNAESGANFSLTADLPIEHRPWQIGLIVGPSGSGKTTLGEAILGPEAFVDLKANWPSDKPIVDAVAPDGDFNAVTAAFASVGLGDVPAWLRPFHALSNGQQYRAGLARLLADAPEKAVVDEFTSVVDRPIAQIISQAFSKAWRRKESKQIVLLSCHYDIIDWLSPDWVYDIRETRFSRDCLQRPKIALDIYESDHRTWPFFKPHYYLDLPNPVSPRWFVGTVDGQPVAHIAVCPMLNSGFYRATRLVVMPEWQGAGVGTKFLEAVCQWHLDGNGTRNERFSTLFHSSHPQLCAYLRRSPLWVQKSARLFGENKIKCAQSLRKAFAKRGKIKTGNAGFGGHFRAVQGFQYLGPQS